mmetsp:Transcript_16995/g.28796  ORF Transcript_16995/g.28796 Transcript_16995/m.28796 type:complete len:274 (+) Transcript_16995:79-900(+)
MKVGSIVLCLGQALYKNQTIPLPLAGRIRHSGDVISSLLRNEEIEPWLIFSGGDAVGSGITEASAMLNEYQKIRGVHDAGHKWILEEESRNTVENALLCEPVLRKLGCRTLYLVTSGFHLPRAKLIFDCVYKDCPYEIVCCPAPNMHAVSIGSAADDINSYAGSENQISDDDAGGISSIRGSSSNSVACVAAKAGGIDTKHSSFRPAYYRVEEDRPLDVNLWTLSERLDWEMNALGGLNSYLAKFDLGPVEESAIQSAIQQLRDMNYTNTSHL